MPLYRYRCKTCGKELEILQPSNHPARLCGPHCVADPRRGDGDLERQIVLPAPPARGAVSATGKLDVDRAANKGFSAYKRQGDGSYEKLAGKDGPKRFGGDD
jgi:putative FmdB family regulatory protein